MATAWGEMAARKMLSAKARVNTRCLWMVFLSLLRFLKQNAVG